MNSATVLAILLLSGTLSAFASTDFTVIDSIGSQNYTIKGAVVLSARALKKKRIENSAVIGDYIELKVNDLNYLFSRGDTCCLKMNDTLIYLSINGMPHPDLSAKGFDKVNNSVIFYLDRNSISFKTMAQRLSSPIDKIVLSSLSICVKGHPSIQSKVTGFSLFFASQQTKLWTVLIIVVIILTFFLLGKYTSILQIGEEDTRYSLALTQMVFWTVLISSSVIYISLTTKNLPDLSGSSLVLMGISITTTAVSKTITDYNKNKPAVKPKKGKFLQDIISDNDGVAVHRLQVVLWTCILGVIFILRVFINQKIPDFPENYLLLTGISSGTYVLLKTVENRNKPDSEDKSQKPKEEPEIPAMG